MKTQEEYIASLRFMNLEVYLLGERIKNPVDHPMGGGAGKTSGGGHPVTPWGVITKGYKTRVRRKYSNRFILVRRDGRPMKQR